MQKSSGGLKKSAYVTLRVDPVTDQLWEDTAKALGLSKVALCEMAIRIVARQHNIPERQVEKEEAGV